MSERLSFPKKANSRSWTSYAKSIAIPIDTYNRMLAIKKETGYTLGEIADKCIRFALDHTEEGQEG